MKQALRKTEHTGVTFSSIMITGYFALSRMREMSLPGETEITNADEYPPPK